MLFPALITHRIYQCSHSTRTLSKVSALIYDYSKHGETCLRKTFDKTQHTYYQCINNQLSIFSLAHIILNRPVYVTK